MNLKQLKLLVLIQFLAISAFAQMSTTFPLHEGIKYGKLENGMTYYILHNEETKNRASFYFAQNVGAILEEDSQNGLAHFLEHMAFNGTKHFEGKGILNFLEKNGVRFGADINAYTAQDQTVYNLSSVPTDRNGLVDSCLLVLHDWSGYLLLKENEIDSERGVIQEEWRTRRNSRFRINSQTSKTLYKDSKYAVRDVIGDLDVIKNFKYDALRAYYKKWYRPDLQAVIVVGDVDVNQVEAKIKERFSAIPLAKDAAKREYYYVPENKEILYTQATDPESTNTAVALIYKKAQPLVKDDNFYRVDIMQKMYQNMISNRFKELTQSKNSNSFNLFAGFFSMNRTTSVFYLNASPKEGKGKESFEEMMSEIERVSRFGFTQSELERAKMFLLNEYQTAYNKRDKINNDQWASQITSNFLEAEPLLSPDKEIELAKNVINSIQLSELNTWAKSLQTDHNRVIMVTGPEKDKSILPSEDDLKSVLTKVKAANLEAYAEDNTQSSLISKALTGSKVKSNFEVKGIAGAKGYILGNGAKVVLMPTEHNQDQVLFQAYSYGGRSLISQENLASADAAISMTKASGISEFDAAKLEKMLTGKTVRINPYIAELNEGFNGTSSMKDLETLLQLTYLAFESPRFDKDMYNITLEQWANYAKLRENNSVEAFRDSTSAINTNRSKRVWYFNQDFLSKVDFKKVEETYKSRFNNAADFTFVFVGKMDEKTALPLIEKYIGSIASTGKTEKFTDHNLRPVKGASKLHFQKAMEVPKSTVYVNLNGEMKYNLQNRLCVNAVEQLLSKRYLETIREEEGGSYGVGVRSELTFVPKEEFSLFLRFDCDPAKQDKLLSIVWKEIEALKNGKVVAKDLTEIKQNFIKMRKEMVTDNNFWMEAINQTLKTNAPFTNDAEYEKIVQSINEALIGKVAKQMFSKANSTEVIMKNL